jgi:mannose-6-phosphate isomerase-like protein (cupin superfamily)
MTYVPVRRVVTGHDDQGRAVVLTDGEPPVIVRSPMQAGLAFHEIWNTDRMPAVIEPAFDEPTLGHTDTAPPRNGTVIRIVDLPPEGPDGPKLDKDQARALFSVVGLAENAEHHKAGRHPLMHRTESIDYGIVLSGEIVLLLDDGEVHLKQGDVVVQRGTIHAWTNRTDTICRMAFILTDGRFAPDLARAVERWDAKTGE